MKNIILIIVLFLSVDAVAQLKPFHKYSIDDDDEDNNGYTICKK
ncbi:MAG: hypothetical protein V4581_08965 [Bacteroidota bacterium]